MHSADAYEYRRLAAAIARGERAAVAEALNLLDDRRPCARQQAVALLAQLQHGQETPQANSSVSPARPAPGNPP